MRRSGKTSSAMRGGRPASSRALMRKKIGKRTKGAAKGLAKVTKEANGNAANPAPLHAWEHLITRGEAHDLSERIKQYGENERALKGLVPRPETFFSGVRIKPIEKNIVASTLASSADNGSGDPGMDTVALSGDPVHASSAPSSRTFRLQRVWHTKTTGEQLFSDIGKHFIQFQVWGK